MRGAIRNAVAVAASVLAITAGRGADLVCPPESLRPVLASPYWETDGFRFHLDGASNATYLIEVSTNLSDWTVFATNAGGTWIRLQPAFPQTYVRAVLEDPVYPLFNFVVRAEGVEFVRVLVDSYDSSDPRYSTMNGEYDPAKAKDGGDLALGSGFQGENDLGNSTIKGKIMTVPNASVTLGPSAQIGSTAWHLAGSTGIEPGWMTDNLRPTFMPEPASAPFTTGAVPASGSVGGRFYEYVLGTGDYVLDRLNGEVFVAGNARLLVSGLMWAKGILISSNASLQIFCAAPDAIFGGVSNQAGIGSFQFYGLASNVSINFSEALLLKGLFYAPTASFNIASGGADSTHLHGACVVRYLRAHDTCIHFDEDLKRFCPP